MNHKLFLEGLLMGIAGWIFFVLILGLLGGGKEDNGRRKKGRS